MISEPVVLAAIGLSIVFLANLTRRIAHSAARKSSEQGPTKTAVAVGGAQAPPGHGHQIRQPSPLWLVGNSKVHQSAHNGTQNPA